MIIQPPIRIDPAGNGHYGASRGSRTHTGIDWHVAPGSAILAPEDGIVGRYGYAYASDLQWRIVDFHGESGHRWRYFYCEQDQYKNGDRVKAGTVICTAQDISRRYPDRGMKPHVHQEAFASDGNRVNPSSVVV